MIQIAKVLVLMFAVVGVVAMGSVSAAGTNLPLEKAKSIHQIQLSADSGMPVTALKGIQTAYDQSCSVQEMWIAKHLLMNEGWLEDI